ncbi:MAG: hypothetical protein KDJ41_19460, partial [Hyphomicrobiaceae bacterium]|nr:hypothetical protein [Hyphomicrobiaceae bacterium]
MQNTTKSTPDSINKRNKILLQFLVRRVETAGLFPAPVQPFTKASANFPIPSPVPLRRKPVEGDLRLAAEH